VVDTAKRLAEAGLDHLKLSVKAARVSETVAVNRRLARATDWPLHLGLTEAGPPPDGETKSAACLAILLSQGLGDTIRISLTADPVWEVAAAYRLLRALGLRLRGVDLVSCPTCGRCRGPVIPLAQELRRRLDREFHGTGLTLAVMGCDINGPAEARAADAGVAAAGDHWVLFHRGRPQGRVADAEVVDRLLDLARSMATAPSE
jgi:(E)-4-hydroxy-3-methylbut-2-enyl-diphosphate synthase